MRLLYLNPNSTDAMTQSIVEVARAAVPGHQVDGWTNHAGPPAIQGPEDGDRAVEGLRALLPRAQTVADALIIGCFDDTGLDELRALSKVPVIGIGQAAYHMASLAVGSFAVVTTLAVSVPVIEANIEAQGFAGQCRGVFPSGIPVLEVEAGAPSMLAQLAEAIVAAKSDAVVLGCAGMAAHRSALQAQVQARLIDGVVAAARLAVAMGEA